MPSVALAARVVSLLLGLASCGWVLVAVSAAPTEGRPQRVALGLLLLPAHVDLLRIAAGRADALLLRGVPLHLLVLAGLPGATAWAIGAAWLSAVLHVLGWGRWREAALASAPGLVCVTLGQATCLTGFLAFACGFVLARSLGRRLTARAPSSLGRWQQLLCFLGLSGAMLGVMLLALPAPHWLGSATTGRHAALIGLSLAAALAQMGIEAATQGPAEPG